MLTEIVPKNPKFNCEICKYITNNKKDYTKHLDTSKHKSQSGVNNLLTNLSPKSPDEKIINFYIKKLIIHLRTENNNLFLYSVFFQYSYLIYKKH